MSEPLGLMWTAADAAARDTAYDEALAELRAASDLELAITLKVFSRMHERVLGGRAAVVEAAAERLMARPPQPSQLDPRG